MTSRSAGGLLQPATRWPDPRRAAPIARLELEQLDVDQVHQVRGRGADELLQLATR